MKKQKKNRWTEIKQRNRDRGCKRSQLLEIRWKAWRSDSCGVQL